VCLFDGVSSSRDRVFVGVEIVKDLSGCIIPNATGTLVAESLIKGAIFGFHGPSEVSGGRLVNVIVSVGSKLVSVLPELKGEDIFFQVNVLADVKRECVLVHGLVEVDSGLPFGVFSARNSGLRTQSDIDGTRFFHHVFPGDEELATFVFVRDVLSFEVSSQFLIFRSACGMCSRPFGRAPRITQLHDFLVDAINVDFRGFEDDERMATTDIAGLCSSDHLEVLSSGPLLHLLPG